MRGKRLTKFSVQELRATALPGTHHRQPAGDMEITAFPATQAIIQGVPVFTGPDSLAWPVANKDLTTISLPFRPDRTQWFNDLAYTEWTIEEISEGLPLKHLTF